MASPRRLGVRACAATIRQIMSGALGSASRHSSPEGRRYSLSHRCPSSVRAPQKIVYLTADYLQRGGIRTNVDLEYFVHAPVIFGVPFFARECAKVAERYGVKVHYQHNLVAIDAKAKTALFEIVGGDSQGQRISVPYDMLHVSPPQSPPDDISL